jgi:hypothetical protein
MIFDSFITSLRSSIAGLAAIPVAVHLPVIIALITGCLLCLVGAKLLKVAYVITFAAALSIAVGLMAPNFLGAAVFGVPSALAGVLVGACLGGLLAVATFRFTLGLAAAITFGAAGLLIASVYLATVPGAIPETAAHQERLVSAWDEHATKTRDALGIDQAKRLAAAAGAKMRGEQAPEPSKEDQESAALAASETRQFADEAFAAFHDLWNSLPGDSRLTLIAAAIGSAMLGFVLAILAPLKGAAAITSMFGSLVCVTTGTWLLTLAGLIHPAIMTHSDWAWLAIWAGIALAGFMIQIPKRHASSSNRAEPAAG